MRDRRLWKQLRVRRTLRSQLACVLQQRRKSPQHRLPHGRRLASNSRFCAQHFEIPHASDQLLQQVAAINLTVRSSRVRRSEDELKARILNISTDEGNFTSTASKARRRPGPILPGCLPMATAALDADENLRARRLRLVPARLSEEDFWCAYFWHVANIKCDLLHDWRTANGARRAAAMEDDATLSIADVDAIRAEANHGPEEAAEETMDDLDAEFERLVSSPTK